jgi:hypothetical protein
VRDPSLDDDRSVAEGEAELVKGIEMEGEARLDLAAAAEISRSPSAGAITSPEARRDLDSLCVALVACGRPTIHFNSWFLNSSKRETTHEHLSRAFRDFLFHSLRIPSRVSTGIRISWSSFSIDSTHPSWSSRHIREPVRFTRLMCDAHSFDSTNDVVVAGEAPFRATPACRCCRWLSTFCIAGDGRFGGCRGLDWRVLVIIMARLPDNRQFL